MLGAAFYVMAIFGCADDEATCQEIRVIATRYTTADVCVAATPAVLTDASDIAFPVLIARCRPASAAMVDAQKQRPRG